MIKNAIYMAKHIFNVNVKTRCYGKGYLFNKEYLCKIKKRKKSERIYKQQTQGTLEVLIYDENFKTFRRNIENNFLITGLGNYFLDMTHQKQRLKN